MERTIVVDQSPEAVWEFLADFTTTEEWDPPTLTTRRVSGTGGVGTTYHNVSKFQGDRTEVDYVVTEYVENERLQLHGRGTAIALVDTITLTGTPSGGTEVTYQAEYTARGGTAHPSFQAPALAVLGDFVAESLQDSLANLDAPV